jgi:predicted NodU family carbamoyl transferase
MRILGLSSFKHDTAAALLEDGRITAAIKNDSWLALAHVDCQRPQSASVSMLHQSDGIPETRYIDVDSWIVALPAPSIGSTASRWRDLSSDREPQVVVAFELARTT